MAQPANVQVEVKTELQYDYDVPKLVSGGSALASTLDYQSCQNIYLISGNSVLNAYQSSNAAFGNESPSWQVEDMLLPTGVTPVLLRVATQPDSLFDTLFVTTSDNKFYYLEGGHRYPSWSLVSNPTSFNIVDLQATYDKSSVLRVSVVLFQNGSHIAYDVNLTNGQWFTDRAVQTATVSISDYVFSTDFGSSTNNTQFGYLIATGNGLTAVTSGMRNNPSVVATRNIVSAGQFANLSTVSLPYTNAMPLSFAIGSQTQIPVYFLANNDGTFTFNNPFGQMKATSLKACLRKAANPAAQLDPDGNLVPPPTIWIELFALDINGSLWHVESNMDREPIPTAADSFATYYAITAWKDPAKITNGLSSFALLSTPDGFASITAVGQDTSLQVWTQDPSTTDWNMEKVALPDGSGGTQVVKKTTYYCEVSLYNAELIPLQGATAVVGGVQFTNLTVNGRAATIDSVRSFTGNTNSFGKLCFSYDAPDSLAAPTLSLWLQGMAPDERIDVAPGADIQQKFKTITWQDLQAATNQVTGQPVINAEQPALEVLATGLNTVMTIFDPDQSHHDTPHPQPQPQSKAVHRRKYLKHSVPSHRAMARLRHQKTLGHIRGSVRLGCHIRFATNGSSLPDRGRRYLDVQPMTDVEAASKIDDMHALGLPFWNVSWGDLFSNIVDGAVQLATMTFKSITDGVEAFLTIVKDGITYAWNGVVSFVRQAFDAVAAMFEAVKVFFQDLFDWLAFLLDWNTMKHTAETFKQFVFGFQQEGQDWLSNTLPNATASFFNSLKVGLDAAVDSAKTTMQGVTMASYDGTSSQPSILAEVTSGSQQGLLDDLPSTALWLLNKILNAGGETSAYFFTSASVSSLEAFFTSFAEAAEKAGLRDDFNAAVNEFTALFATFFDRNAADGTAFNHLLDLMKNAVFVVIDIIETLVLVFENLAYQTFRFFTELLNVPVDLPIVSLIFKEVTGTDLTIINSVCYALAVPFTIIFKAITGRIPFESSNPLLHKAARIRAQTPADDLAISRGIFALLNTPLDANVDLTGVVMDVVNQVAQGVFVPNRFINGMSLIVPVLNGSLSAASLASGDPRQITTWSIGVISPIVSVAWFVASLRKKGPCGDPVGMIIIGLTGLGQLGTAIWHASAPAKDPSGKVSPKEQAAITSQFFAFLSPTVKPLRWITQRTENPYALATVAVAMPVVDIISGVGNGSALIASGSS